MKKSIITLALSVVLSTSACGASTSASSEGSPSTGTSEPAETTDEGTEPAPDSAAPEEADLSQEAGGESLIQSFGETFIYDDGIKVIVSQPTPMVSSYNEKGSSFQVTVANTGDAQFDPALMSLTAQSGNTESEQIFDTANGYEGTPTTVLLPGREVVFDVAFVTADPNDIVLEISPSWDHDTVIYVTNANG